MARLTPIREGTRFALSVSPRSQPLGVSRVTHKRFLFFFGLRGHLVKLTDRPPSSSDIVIVRDRRLITRNTMAKSEKSIYRIECLCSCVSQEFFNRERDYKKTLKNLLSLFIGYINLMIFLRHDDRHKCFHTNLSL